MKKLLIVSLVSFFIVACNDNTEDSIKELVELSKEEQAKHLEEDKRAKEAMDMSQGATVYQITTPSFGAEGDQRRKEREQKREERRKERENRNKE